jgi:hypothetical protein
VTVLMEFPPPRSLSVLRAKAGLERMSFAVDRVNNAAVPSALVRTVRRYTAVGIGAFRSVIPKALHSSATLRAKELPEVRR